MNTALMICADVLGMRPGQYMVCPYLLLRERHIQLATASLLWAIWLSVFAMVVQGHQQGQMPLLLLLLLLLL
jgi:hypothetical protein